MGAEQRCVPAAGRRIFTLRYDPVVAATTRERRFREPLLAQIVRDVPTGGTVADVGCGTGTFAIALAAARPDARIIGIDGDPEILELARRKAGADRVDWRRGLAHELPADAVSRHGVVMSLLLHHLGPTGKRDALAEARRVLTASGSLHIADWGRPHGPVMRAAFLVLQSLDGFENTRDHAAGRLPVFLRDAGFHDPETRARLRTAWGSLEILRAAVAG